MTTYRATSLTTLCLICLLETVRWATAGAQGTGVKYASERSPYPFVGATRVVVERFDPKDKDATSARFLMDKNEVTFSSFGEPRITAVLYNPVPVILKRLDTTDPSGKDRRVF